MVPLLPTALFEMQKLIQKAIKDHDVEGRFSIELDCRPKELCIFPDSQSEDSRVVNLRFFNVIEGQEGLFSLVVDAQFQNGEDISLRTILEDWDF